MKAELIEAMGSDLTVVNAARVSFDKESEWARFDCHECQNSVKKACSDNCDCVKQGARTDGPTLSVGDSKLISYLAKHGHFTPFTHPQITLRETVPIFVARQRFKHVVGFTYNEVSRRYVDDEPKFYVPEVWRSRPEGSVKQGSGLNGIVKVPYKVCINKDRVEDTEPEYRKEMVPVDNVVKYVNAAALSAYKALISGGVAPEQARMVLPQSMYTSYYVTGSLAAFARMCKQRLDPHAQHEIQELAKMVDEIIRPLYPESWKALMGE